MKFAVGLLTTVIVMSAAVVGAQGLGGSGTIPGVVKDPTGGVMVSVPVAIANPVTGFKKATRTDAAGRYTFTNLPPNPYHVVVTTQGFAPFGGDVDVRSGVPIEFNIALNLAGTT